MAGKPVPEPESAYNSLQSTLLSSDTGLRPAIGSLKNDCIYFESESEYLSGWQWLGHANLMQSVHSVGNLVY